LSFSRIKNIYYEAAFDEVYTLNTLLKAIPTNPQVTKKERTYPNYLIAMLGSEAKVF
jgi:membrane carboxypeptidase/penicillin-binding protein